MRNLIKFLTLILLASTSVAQIVGTPPYLNYRDIYFTQQVTNGSTIPFLNTCFQRVQMGEATPNTSQPLYTHCGIPYRYIHAGNNIEIWTTAGNLSACPHVATTSGYPCIFLVDIVLQGCAPIFPPTIPFPGAYPGADSYQLIVPEASLPTHSFYMTFLGQTIWYYWITIPTPPSTVMIGSWVSTQAVRLDSIHNALFFSNRTDALIGPPYAPN